MTETTLRDLLSIEDDPAIPDVVCEQTGIPVWTELRVAFLRRMLSDLTYGNTLTAERPRTHPPLRPVASLIRTALHNRQVRRSSPLRAELCLTSDGVGDRVADRVAAGQTFNRFTDYFADASGVSSLTLQDLFEWRYSNHERHGRTLYLTPFRSRHALAQRVLVRERHRRRARQLVSLVIRRAHAHVGWRPRAGAEDAMVTFLSRKIASLPGRYRDCTSLLAEIRPRLIMILAASYGPSASLVVAARRLGIVTTEFQHGSISAGHDAYNFGNAVREHAAYRETLPEYFLAYGSWWAAQVNAPFTSVIVGNPHRAESVRDLAVGGSDKTELLLLSDGFEFRRYLELAERLAELAAGSGLTVVLRPHPSERTEVFARYGARIGSVTLDRRPDLYAALVHTRALISEVSTGLFEAVGFADKIFVWDTPKSRFAFPRHPFSQIASADSLWKAILDPASGRISLGDAEAIWAGQWRERFAAFLAARGIGAAPPSGMRQSASDAC